MQERTYIRVTATGLSRHQRAAIVKKITALDWKTEVIRDAEHDIHVVDRILSMRSHNLDGLQNHKTWCWGPLKDLGLFVEYSNANGSVT